MPALCFLVQEFQRLAYLTNILNVNLSFLIINIFFNDKYNIIKPQKGLIGIPPILEKNTAAKSWINLQK